MTPEEEQVLIAQAAQGAQAWQLVQLIAQYNPDLIAGPGRLHFGNKAMRLDSVGIQIRSLSADYRGALYFVAPDEPFMLAPPAVDAFIPGLYGRRSSVLSSFDLRAGHPSTLYETTYAGVTGAAGSSSLTALLRSLRKDLKSQAYVRVGTQPDSKSEVWITAESVFTGRPVETYFARLIATRPEEGTGTPPTISLLANGGLDSGDAAQIKVSGGAPASDSFPALKSYISLQAPDGAYVSISGAPLVLPTNAGAFAGLTTDGMVQYDTTADKALLRANGVTETLATEGYVDTAIAAIPAPTSGGGYATHFLLMGA